MTPACRAQPQWRYSVIDSNRLPNGSAWMIEPHRYDRGFSTPELLLTKELVQQAKGGDATALNAILSRYLPRLRRWAHGRLPDHARSLLETNDLVHETLFKALEGFDARPERGPGSFQAYVRQAILNRIRDQIRWARRRSGSLDASAMADQLVDKAPTPLDNAIHAELLDRFERACEQLNEEERLFVHLKVELDLDYDEIAAVMDRPTRDAARMGVRRAMRKLAE